MVYKVTYWDDRNDCAVAEATVVATNLEEAEELAAQEYPAEALRYPIQVTMLPEEEGSKFLDKKYREELKKELKEFGIETFLHEHLKSTTAQLVLSKFCAEVLDRLSEEDLDALTDTVIENVLEDL